MTLFVPPANADVNVFTLFGSNNPHQHIFFLPITPPVQPLIYGSISDDLTVVQPLQINIEQDDDSSFVVSDDIFLVYGSGEDREEAIGDYIESLIGLYQILKIGAESDQFDRKEFEHLEAYIQPKSRRGYNAVQANRD